MGDFFPQQPAKDAAGDGPLVSHLEALRRALISIFAVTGLLYVPAFFAAPYLIRCLSAYALPPEIDRLHYFSPMEVFIVELKLALVTALVAAFPWNMRQIWRFLLPALYEKERRALKYWIAFATILFFAGAAFCIGVIVPLVMRFSGGFAGKQLVPVIGLSGFVELTGWLTLAFGIMFQCPIAVVLLVRFGVVSRETLSAMRPYVVVIILFISAILTPPDILSQVLLALPTWLLFEFGLLLAGKQKK